MARLVGGAAAGENEGPVKKDRSKDQGPHARKPTTDTQHARHQAGKDQRQGVANHLHPRLHPLRIQDRKHTEAGPGILVPVDPGDRQEMRDLPEKDNQE